jgi:hypothetical protein
VIDEKINSAGLGELHHNVADLKIRIKRDYDRSVNRDLSQQQWQDLFRRNVTAVLRQAYGLVLAELEKLPTSAEGLAVDENAQEACALVLKSFDGLIEELILYALQKHRSSCALSNFPEEHNPSQEYIAAVIEEACRDWSAFVARVNTLMSTDV